MQSTPSIMDNKSANVLEYRSYLLSMSVVFTIKDILRRSVFVSSSSKEHRNFALNVVELAISSSFEKIQSYYSALWGSMTSSPILYCVRGFVGRVITFSPIAWICLI